MRKGSTSCRHSIRRLSRNGIDYNTVISSRLKRQMLSLSITSCVAVLLIALIGCDPTTGQRVLPQSNRTKTAEIPDTIDRASWDNLIHGRVYAHCLKENGVINSFQEIAYLRKIAADEGFNPNTFFAQIGNSTAFIRAAESFESQSGGCLNIAETQTLLQNQGITYEQFLQSKGIPMKAESESRSADVLYCQKGKEYNEAYGKSFIKYIEHAFLNTHDPQVPQSQRQELYIQTIASLQRLCPYVW